MSCNIRQSLVVGALLVVIGASTSAQSRVEKNVVFGMYSGAALLLDVHYPAKSNGFGVIFISGSGWNAPLGYSATPLKESPQVEMYAPSLLQAGYTVFALTHRATPTFRHPAQLEDVQRAVRFIRHNASRYGIDPARIGGVGGSSGAHLISLLATLDGAGDSTDPDPTNRESAKLQCVVARAAPVDLTQMGNSIGGPLVSLLLGARIDDTTAKGTIEVQGRLGRIANQLRLGRRSASAADPRRCGPHRAIPSVGDDGGCTQESERARETDTDRRGRSRAGFSRRKESSRLQGRDRQVARQVPSKRSSRVSRGRPGEEAPAHEG